MIFKSTFIVLLFLFTVTQISAQSGVETMLEKAEQLMDEKDELAALEAYLDVLEEDPENYDALWNASLLHSSIGYRYENKNTRKEYYERAQYLAQKALDFHEDRVHPYYVMAVAKGRMADLVGVRKRIVLAHSIEDYVIKALDIMPDHAPSWHLYGVWQSEVANVRRAERIAARFISSGLPDGSNDKAEEYLKKAMEIDPESILIRLDLARHFIKTGREERAIPILEDLLALEPNVKDDTKHLQDAKKYLADLRE